MFCSIIGTAQSAENAAYENQQRARRLLQMDAEISTLPDVEIRCQLRFDILEFVYSSDARSEFVAAEGLLISLLEEMKANEKQLGSRAASWRNSLALVLRKHAPDTARKIEAKYVREVDTSDEDYKELRNSDADRKAIADRALARLRSGKNIYGILSIFETLQQTDKAAAERILIAVLDWAEKHTTPELAGLLNRLIAEPYNPAPIEISLANVFRFYRILVAAARIELLTAKPDEYLHTLTPLRRAVLRIGESDKQLYAAAQSVLAGYRSRLSKDALAKEEAIGRIEAAGDKMEQAIAEAEAAKDQQTKDFFLAWAASLAGQEGNYRQAVDLMMKASPDLGMPNRPKGRDEDIAARVVRPAMGKRAYSSANYAIENIKDKLERAKAMLELGDEMGRWQVNDRAEATTIVFSGLDLMETTASDPWSICLAGNTRHLLMYGGQSRITLEDFTARAVGMVNRIPTEGADAKVGTPERAKFVSETLNRALSCVAHLFRPVMSAHPAPNPDLTGQIKVKEWRVAAEIMAEKHRKYTPSIPPPQ